MSINEKFESAKEKARDIEWMVKDYYSVHADDIKLVAAYGMLSVASVFVGRKVGKFVFRNGYDKGVSDALYTAEILAPESNIMSKVAQNSIKSRTKK